MPSKLRHKLRRLSPPEILILGFALMILTGTVLLQMPFCAADNQPIPFLDALFTATSAVCVTGLSVFDAGSTLSFGGQIVLLILIQCGGLGFMTLTSAVYGAAHLRLSLSNKLVLRDALNETGVSGLLRFASRILAITGLCEGTGAIILMMRFVPHYGVTRGVWYSFFTAISAFCNAGFDVFGMGNSLMPYATDVLVMVTVMALIVLGGLGFFVVLEIGRKIQGEPRRRVMSLQSRVVLTLSGLLLGVGAIVFALAEWDNPATLGQMAPGDRILGAAFQSVSTRTAGFASFDQGSMRPVSEIVSTVLMFIGASPAGTGGGLKTTTVAVLLAFMGAVMTGRSEVNMFKRKINEQLVHRALTMFALGIMIMVIGSSVISVLEPTVPLAHVIFETSSAFGTVGLTAGVTPTLSVPSLIVLICMMFGGRVGYFSVSLALAYRFTDRETYTHYAEENIMIG